MLIIYICIFFLGASLASFINATLYRLDNGFKYPDIVFKNSHCEMCKKELTWYELLPVIGYLIIRGKCPKCGTKINPYYPISELFLGITILSFYLYNVQWYYWIIIFFLFALSYFDMKYMSVPKSIVHVLLGLCLIIFFVFKFDLINILVPIITILILLLMNLFKKSFGLGDILIVLGIGILFSYQEFLVFFWVGILTALLYSVYVIVVKKVKIKKAKISMVPFFTVSFTISCLFAEPIYSYILKFLQM